MGRTDEELRQMLKRDAEDERFVFTEPMLEEESREFIRTARTLLEHELLVSAVDARKQADYYWEGNESAREEGVAEELSFVGTRVRILNGSLQMEWFRNRTRPDQGAGKQVFSTHLKKGKGYRYSDSLFKNEPKWARDAIKLVEDRYELLRKRAAILSAMRKNLRDYEQLLTECFPGKKDEKDKAKSAGSEQEKPE